jgi:hypothetical protein
MEEYKNEEFTHIVFTYKILPEYSIIKKSNIKFSGHEIKNKTKNIFAKFSKKKIQYKFTNDNGFYFMRKNNNT